MQEITYCLSCKKDTRNIDPRIVKTKNNKRVMSSKCSICNNKKSTFISQGSGLFDSLGLNTPQNRVKMLYGMPSTCECQCDMWCKPGQYLDYKKCIYKNKLIGRVISECTSLINETMNNNKKNIAYDDTTTIIFIGLFSVLMFAGITCFCIFAYFKWIKGKNLFKKIY